MYQSSDRPYPKNEIYGTIENIIENKPASALIRQELYWSDFSQDQRRRLMTGNRATFLSLNMATWLKIVCNEIKARHGSGKRAAEYYSGYIALDKDSSGGDVLRFDNWRGYSNVGNVCVNSERDTLLVYVADIRAVRDYVKTIDDRLYIVEYRNNFGRIAFPDYQDKYTGRIYRGHSSIGLSGLSRLWGGN